MKFIRANQLVNTKDSSLLIVDIRDKTKYDEWHIQGSINIDVCQEIWSNNFDGAKEKLKNLPKDKTIVTVCNAGITAQKASAILDSLGYETMVLEHGMKGWNLVQIVLDVINEEDLVVKQIVRIGKGCLSYVVCSKKECFIVDPSRVVGEYLTIAKEHGYTLRGVLETHVHADHLSGATMLVEQNNIPYSVSGNDFMAKKDFIDLDHKNKITIGNAMIKIIKTPGHTDGSVCFMINNKVILTGDTLFLDGVGRPDLGRNKNDVAIGAKNLFYSVKKLKNLNKDLLVLPAHFSKYSKFPISETLGSVLEKNYACKIDGEHEFIEYIVNNLPAPPPNYEQIKSTNRMFTHVAQEIAEQLEFGPNRCASV